jgi:hypothetical protein
MMRTKLILAVLASGALHSAMAHVSYSGRYFDNFGGGNPQTISIGNLSSDFGWADATDADFGDSHRTRAFRITLTTPGEITITVQGAMVGAASAVQYPAAFSIYSGLTHIAPEALAHDSSPLSVSYLAGLGGMQPREGALYALGNWVIANEDVYNVPGDPGSGVAVPATLRHLTYLGHVADGSPANYGAAPGVNGDGVADGIVTGTFVLPTGEYTLMIGGANYATQGPGPHTNFGLVATVVPEPAAAALLAVGALFSVSRRRRG